MTIALQSKLTEDHHAHGFTAHAQARSYAHAYAPARRARRARRARVERIVERVAQGQLDDHARIERLVVEAGERLEDTDLLGDVMRRPLSEIPGAPRRPQTQGLQRIRAGWGRSAPLSFGWDDGS